MQIERVILIDDNKVDNLVNERMIKNCCQIDEIIVFDNPRKAFEWFCSPEGSNRQKAENSIVLLDINMPDLTGFDLLELLENKHPTGFPNYLILMLTSSTDMSDQLRASNYTKVLGYFHKPLNPQKINKSLMPLVSTWFGKAS